LKISPRQLPLILILIFSYFNNLKLAKYGNKQIFQSNQRSRNRLIPPSDYSEFEMKVNKVVKEKFGAKNCGVRSKCHVLK